MTSPSASRRRFLHVIAAGGAAAAGASVLGCGGVGKVDAGSLSDLPAGSLRQVGQEPVAIGRDAGGVYAITLNCTHSNCNIADSGIVSPDGLVCGCHGSRFDANGAVRTGPARSPLDHYKVTIDAAGKITIDGDSVVPPSTRLKV